MEEIGKKGDMKWDIIIALILGIIFLGFALFFIFPEYFSEDELSWEACRQSIYLRASLPEVTTKDLTLKSFKDEFPLKCKTEVVEITEQDIKEGEAGKIIADTMVECWYLYGNGDYDIFPSKFFKTDSFCVPCARVSLSADAEEYMNQNPDVKIDIENALENEKKGDFSYINYLNEIGSKPAISEWREIDSDKFEIGEVNISYDESTLFGKVLGLGLVNLKVVHEPKFFNAGDGDLIIVYSSVTFSGKPEDESSGAYTPSLIYFQTGQDNPNPFEELEEKSVIGGPLIPDMKLCQNWDGIPA